MIDCERNPQTITIHVKLKAFADAMKAAQEAMEAAFTDLEAQFSSHARKAGE